MSTETITAIATAIGNSAINIIRLSGKESKNIAEKIFRSSNKLEHSKIIYGNIFDSKKNSNIDTVLVSYFKSPKSYTGEDVVEINCHGGRKVTLEVLNLIIKNGATLAKPGEFTKRAFLNGKIDLSQAEAVMDLISADTAKQLKIANRQLEGRLSSDINNILDKLLMLMAGIEVSVDYPEYDFEEIENSKIITTLDSINSEISKYIDTFDEGKIIKEGIKVAIIGKPNVGKSSLLNKLSKQEKAIVTDVAGTTRDIIEETINIDDIILNLVDTAGIRNTDDTVEKIGVDRSIKSIDEAELVLYMIDASKDIDKDDIEILNKISNKPCIVLINKIDISDENNTNKIKNKLQEINSSLKNIINVSVEKEVGIDTLKECILDIYNVGDLDLDNALVISNERHKLLLEKCKIGINRAIDTVKSGMPIEIITTEVRQAIDYLGEIVGKNISDEIVNKIFEKFCLGK